MVLRARAMRGMTLATMRVTLWPVVAITTLLTVVAAVGLGERSVLKLRQGLWRRLQALERFGRGRKVRRQRRDGDALARRPLDIAQGAALVGSAEGDGEASAPGPPAWAR